MELLIHNQSEIDAYAEEVLRAHQGERELGGDKATVIGLSGELGAGKTTFVQALAKVLRITEHVTSPTFVIARFYDVPAHPRFKKLVHIDAYRIEHESELRPLGYESLLADPGNLVVIEWPSLLGKNFPEYADQIFIEVVDQTTRKFFTAS